MFAVCTERQSEEVVSRIVEIQKEVFSGLDLHCRYVLKLNFSEVQSHMNPLRLLRMPEEDLGESASVKFDIEAWMPGRGAWGEISSASNCTDYQSQRLNIRYMSEDGSGEKFAHTCNGTALASARALVALLETHQTVITLSTTGLYQ